MLGFESIGVFLAYILSIGAAVVCVIYGAVNWNVPGDDVVNSEIDEEIQWEKNDPEDEGGCK
jgi:hypothetical protein